MRKILNTLKERPILSIILCVFLSELIQLFIQAVSKKSPSFHYGIAVIALLAFFVTPLMLGRQNDKKNDEDDTKKTS